jgi:ABC-type branched-subunit amino acid transport system permease subunit
VIPTILILAQGVAGETICVQGINGTIAATSYTEPRFSVRIFMFAIASIILASLIAFVLLRWTKIVEKANAAEDVSRSSKTGVTLCLSVRLMFIVELSQTGQIDHKHHRRRECAHGHNDFAGDIYESACADVS